MRVTGTAGCIRTINPWFADYNFTVMFRRRLPPDRVASGPIALSLPTSPRRPVRNDVASTQMTGIVTGASQLLRPILAHWNWQLNAACRGLDVGVFFHPWSERGSARKRRAQLAKAVCQSCPVIQECLEHALRVPEPYGIWGGLSENERADLLGVVSLRYPARIDESILRQHPEEAPS